MNGLTFNSNLHKPSRINSFWICPRTDLKTEWTDCRVEELMPPLASGPRAWATQRGIRPGLCQDGVERCKRGNRQALYKLVLALDKSNEPVHLVRVALAPPQDSRQQGEHVMMPHEHGLPQLKGGPPQQRRACGGGRAACAAALPSCQCP